MMLPSGPASSACRQIPLQVNSGLGVTEMYSLARKWFGQVQSGDVNGFSAHEHK